MKKMKFIWMTLAFMCSGHLFGQSALENVWVSYDFRKGQTIYSVKSNELKITQWNRHGAIQERTVPVAEVVPEESNKPGKIILGPMPDIGGYGVLFYKNLQTDSVKFTTLSFLEKSLFDPKRPRRKKGAQKIKPEFTIGKNTMKVPLALFRSRIYFNKTIGKLPEVSARLSLKQYQTMVDKMLQVLQTWNKRFSSSPERLIGSANIFELLIASGYRPTLESIHHLHKAENQYKKDPGIKGKMRELKRFLNGQY